MNYYLNIVQVSFFERCSFYNRRIDMNKQFYGVASMPKSGRSEIINKAEVPGPGSYDFNKEKSHNELPKWTLKKRIDHGSCFEDLSITPGPGGYEVQQQIGKENGHSSMCRSDKFQQFGEKSYNYSPLTLQGAINQKTGCSFGYRQASQVVERSPGPIYHLDKVVEESRVKKIQNSHRGFGFGEKNTIYKLNQTTPGPGNFSTPNLWGSKTSQSWTFGKGSRKKQIQNSGVGPGEYSPKAISISRSFKLRGKHSSCSKIDNNTGPGSYDLPDTKTKVGTRFNLPKQNCIIEDNQSSNKCDISPFTYNPPRYLQKYAGHGYSLGKKITNGDNGFQIGPGPGSYQVNVKQLKNGGYMGRKVGEPAKENAMDNFYKYQPKNDGVPRVSPKFSFPQGKRFGDKQNAQTAYCQQFYQSLNMKTSSGGFSMGTAKRFGDFKKDAGPFKETTSDFATIGNLPSYLKKTQKKKQQEVKE